MASSSTSCLFLAVAVLLLLPPPSHAQLTCTTQKFTNNNLYNHCTDLPYLNSFLHWTLHPNNTLSLAFLAQPPSSGGWVSWAINPTAGGMVGSQALVAFRAPNGSMAVKTYNISSYASIVEGKLAFDVMDVRGEFEGGVMRIFATVGLPEKGEMAVNQVWQVGSAVTASGFPVKHDFRPENLGSKGRLDLSSGQNTGGGIGGNSRTKKRNIHGILNAVSWGILFPVGAIIARYLRTFPSADPAWFYLHGFCQVSGYAIGVAGWGTGLKLGSESKGVTYTAHRSIGIALFCLATIQMSALFLRPKKEHKLRFYWNMYHYATGYAVLVLGILNVFKGLAILSPESKWRSAYIIVISALGIISLFLEVFTWIVVFKRKSMKSNAKNVSNGNAKEQPLAP